MRVPRGVGQRLAGPQEPAVRGGERQAIDDFEWGTHRRASQIASEISATGPVRVSTLAGISVRMATT